MTDSIYAQWLNRHAELIKQEAEAVVKVHSGSAAYSDLLLTLSAVINDPSDGRESPCRFVAGFTAAIGLAFKEELAPKDLTFYAALLLLDAGIYTLDHIMDAETDAALSHLKSGAVLLGGCSMIGHIPASVILQLDDQPRARALLRMLNDGLAQMAAGQLDDLKATPTEIPSSEQVRGIVGRKTGQRRALYAAMAAVFAGASEGQVRACHDYGYFIGMARQLRSDLQDLFGAFPSRDLASGTVTLPIALALERLADDRQTFLREALVGAALDEAKQRAITDLVRDSGAMRAVVGEVQDCCVRAWHLIDTIAPPPTTRPLLESLVRATAIIPLEAEDIEPPAAATADRLAR